MDEYKRLKDMSVDEANAYLAELQNCTHDCDACTSECASKKPEKPAKKLIAVLGGKGGTGKSLVACLLASALAKLGLKVGILDADVSGPSVPYLLGVADPIKNDGEMIFPAVAPYGIELVSMALVSERPEEPVVWPGADAAKIAAYFYSGARWGKLDVMLVDMPSGTSDVLLEFLSTLPFDLSIAVTEPGKLASLAVNRAINLSRMLMLRVMGVVENFAPDDDEQRIAGLYGETPLLASIPCDPALARAAEDGKVGEYDTSAVDFLAMAIRETLEEAGAEKNK